MAPESSQHRLVRYMAHPDSVPITTRHPMRAQSPYAATKVAADQLCLAWASSFDVDVVILRPFNTYGPRQSMRAVIPTILTQMIANPGDPARKPSHQPGLHLCRRHG